MFNLDVLANQNQVNTRNVFEYTEIQETYSTLALSFISERATEYRNCSKELYKSILEAENVEVINESFSDFFTKVKEIIDKFIKFIKSLFDRFITALARFVSSDKHLKKHKDDFKKFESEHEFRMEGYEFTFSPNVPLVNAQAKFEESFIKLNIKSLSSGTDAEKLAAITKTYNTLINDLKGDRYDKFRGEVIGKGTNYPITTGEYGNELFSIYRNNYSSKEDIDVTSAIVTSSYHRFENYKEFEKQVKKTKDTIEKEYEAIKKQVQNMIYRNKDMDVNKLMSIGVDASYNAGGTVTVTHDVMQQIDKFTKAKVDEIVQMSNIHSMAFSYKLDAISDCYKQDKRLLYTALNRIQKDLKA